MSDQVLQRHAHTQGGPWVIFFLRIGIVFLLLLSVPFYSSYYQSIFEINFLRPGFQDLFNLTYHVPGIIHSSSWGLQSYEGWLWAFFASLILAIIWQLAGKQRNDYSGLYYWGRVAIRYRLALGIIAYGVILLIPVQFPQPTLSDLHSAYGDFLPWKIYYHTTAVASAGYRQTIGAIEILAGVLLLFRRTVLIGAIAIAFILVNVVLANFAYSIGEHLYSSYLLLIALILVAHDVPRLYQLLIKETKVLAERFEPRFSRRLYWLRRSVRFGVTLFLLVLGALTFSSYTTSKWPYSGEPGLKGAAGYYNVSFFKVNDSIHPYSLTDSVRWQDVVLEEWNVLSVRTNQKAPVNLSGPSIQSRAPLSNNYQFEGNGGRRFYTYKHNEQGLKLIDKNSSDVLSFTYRRPNATTIELKGTNLQGDSLLVVLNKIDNEYLLHKGRRKPVSVY